MQYDILRLMDWNEYEKYFTYQISYLRSTTPDNIKKINLNSNEEVISDEFIIKSIVPKENLTLTIYFFKVLTERVEELVKYLQKNSK